MEHERRRRPPRSSHAEAVTLEIRNRNRKQMELEPDSDLVATTNETTPDKDGSAKKQLGKWDPKTNVWAKLMRTS